MRRLLTSFLVLSVCLIPSWAWYIQMDGACYPIRWGFSDNLTTDQIRYKPRAGDPGCFLKGIGGLALKLVNQTSSYLQVPPGESTVVDGTRITNYGSQRSLGLTVEDLELLFFGKNEIAGFESKPRTLDLGGVNLDVPSLHTEFVLDGGGDEDTGPIHSRAERRWETSDGKQGFGVAFWICDSPQSAQNARDNEVKFSQETPRQGSFGVETVGDTTYRWGERNQPDDETVIVYDRLLHLVCYYDRAVIEISGWWEDRNPSAEETKWLDTIAWDAFYRLLNHPKQMVPATKLPVVVEGQSTDQTATMLGNVAVAPVVVLERAGAQLESQQTDNRRSWRLSLGQRWVELVPQRRRLTTSSGEVQLRRPVISHRGTLIVPLEAIGQALGFRVEVEGRTRVLVSREGGG